MTSKKSKGDGKPSRRESSRGGMIGYSVERAGELLGISRSSAYAAIASGDIPSVRVGHLLIVPRQRFHEKFGSLPEGAAA
jgi:excisionase family DNA binding protein